MCSNARPGISVGRPSFGGVSLSGLICTWARNWYPRLCFNVRVYRCSNIEVAACVASLRHVQLGFHRIVYGCAGFPRGCKVVTMEVTVVLCICCQTVIRRSPMYLDVVARNRYWINAAGSSIGSRLGMSHYTALPHNNME